MRSENWPLSLFLSWRLRVHLLQGRLPWRWLVGCASAAGDVIERKPRPSGTPVQQSLYPQCGTSVPVSLLLPASGVLLPGAHFYLSLKDTGEPELCQAHRVENQ